METQTIIYLGIILWVATVELRLWIDHIMISRVQVKKETKYTLI